MALEPENTEVRSGRLMEPGYGDRVSFVDGRSAGALEAKKRTYALVVDETTVIE